MLDRLFHRDRQRRQAMVSAMVVPEPARCVECGICSFNCPIGIDVRTHARQGRPVVDSHCLTCGDCVARCPRGTLRLEPTTGLGLTTARESTTGIADGAAAGVSVP